ncbi:MAG: hypothetical protein WCV84_05485 [Patescibacteria group bacterium]
MRTVTIAGWILLGAIASGVSFGYYLRVANADREALQLRVQTLELQMQQAKVDGERVADEANRKVDDAVKEVTKAQALVTSCEEQRAQIVSALPLAKPDGRTLKTWKETISMALGVSLHVPPGTTVTHDATQINASTPARGQKSSPNWLTITAFNPSREAELTQALENKAAVTYSINGVLAVGVKGRVPGTNITTIVLHAGVGQLPSHLVWAQTTDTMTESRILEALATVGIRS